jgi:drug/metabolite transporter (DMT)-like permease
MIEPAIAAGLAAWFLHERLGDSEILGCLLMVLAILVLMRTEASGQPRGLAAGKAPAKG